MVDEAIDASFILSFIFGPVAGAHRRLALRRAVGLIPDTMPQGTSV